MKKYETTIGYINGAIFFGLNAYSLTYVGYSLTSVIIVICIGVLFVLNFIKNNMKKVKIPLRYLNGIILGMNIEHIYRGETNMLTFFNRWSHCHYNTN
jgi:cellulose synthase/poly-beta-1,6-N-acetylglucosamine synthase-like glycosyltransferase